jgi:hypothetical protein
VWEIKQRVLVDMAADRGAYIDQSQSFNVHMSDPNFGKLTSLHFYAWKKGLKTGGWAGQRVKQGDGGQREGRAWGTRAARRKSGSLGLPSTAPGSSSLARAFNPPHDAACSVTRASQPAAFLPLTHTTLSPTMPVSSHAYTQTHTPASS